MRQAPRLILGLGVAVLVAACQPHQDSRVAELQAEVARLKARTATPPPVPVPTFELVVSWPEKGGNDYRQPYLDAEKCEAARRAVFEENARRAAEKKERVDAQNAEMGPGPGYRLMYTPPPAASAVCLPL